jgi:hypothetical protein
VQIDSNGKEISVKLIKQTFFKVDEIIYEQICFQGTKYTQVTGIFERNEVEIRNKMYSVLRVCFYKKDWSRIFKDDMLSITSLVIYGIAMAMSIWELYMQRSKIEQVLLLANNFISFNSFDFPFI